MHLTKRRNNLLHFQRLNKYQIEDKLLMSGTIFAALKEKTAISMNKFMFIALFVISQVALTSQTLQDGISQYRNENYAMALKSLQSITRSEPKNCQAWYYLGLTYYALEQQGKARETFVKGIESNSDCSENHAGLAMLALDEKNKSEVEKQVAKALNGNKKNAEIHALVGDAFMNSKNPNILEAINYYTKARDINPKSSVYYYKMGTAYEANKDYGNAMTNYENASEKDKNNIDVQIRMGRIWARGGQASLAIKNLENATTMAPNYAPAYKELYEVYLRERRFKEMVPVLKKYVALAGDDQEARIRLVKFLIYSAKDYENGITYANEILQQNPNEFTMHRWLAWAYQETGKDSISYVESTKFFEEVKKHPEAKTYSSDYEYMAKAASKLKRVDEAEKLYSKVFELDPTRNDIYDNIAQIYWDNKDWSRCLAAYRTKLVALGPNNDDLVRIGLCEYYLDRFTAADSTFSILTTNKPNYDYGWLMRAKANNQMDPDRVQFLAKPFYEEYIRLQGLAAPEKQNKKNLTEAHKYLGYYFNQNNDPVSALSHYTLALQNSPTDSEAMQAVEALSGKR